MNQGTGLSSESDGPGSVETFSALDSVPAPGTSTWVHASPNHAEAGFQDPALGWVGVRADVSGSGIHAAVVSGSGDAAQVLGGHLAGLNAYLAEHHTPVETLTVAVGREAGSLGQDTGQTMQQGTGHGSGQESNSGQQLTERIQMESPRLAVSPGSGGRASEPNPVTQTAGHGGIYISVIA